MIYTTLVEVSLVMRTFECRPDDGYDPGRGAKYLFPRDRHSGRENYA